MSVLTYHDRCYGCGTSIAIDDESVMDNVTVLVAIWHTLHDGCRMKLNGTTLQAQKQRREEHDG